MGEGDKLSVNWEGDPYDGLVKVMDDSLEARETVKVSDGVYVARRDTERNLCSLIVDSNAIVTFDASETSTTAALGRALTRIAKRVRAANGDEEEVKEAAADVTSAFQ